MLNRLFIMTVAALLSVTAVSYGARESAREPVEELAQGRFIFAKNGHDVAVRCDFSVLFNEENTEIKHFVVMVHGFMRRPHYHHTMLDALEFADAPETVAVASPQFLTAVDLIDHDLGDRYAYWSRNGWPIGHLSRNDDELPRDVRVSSFTVVDELVQRARSIFPNLETITLAGFSAGGQFMNRYAGGNRQDEALRAAGLDVSYIVASPSSYMYLSEERPISFKPVVFGPLSQTDYPNCETFNDYRYGLDKLNVYMEKTGAAQIIAQYPKRKVFYLIGEEDDERASKYLSVSEPSMLQGKHRLQRSIVYQDYLVHLYGKEVLQLHQLSKVPGTGHKSRGTFISDEGAHILLESMGLD
jgi:hypothetical protein